MTVVLLSKIELLQDDEENKMRWERIKDEDEDWTKQDWMWMHFIVMKHWQD